MRKTNEPWDAPKDYPRPILCPICGHAWAPNGIGPQNSPRISRALQKLPSTKYFNQAGDFHDLFYLVCPVRPVRVWFDGKPYTIRTKAEADQFFLDRMLEAANSAPWRWRGIFRWAARRNYKFVDKLGDDSFAHVHLTRGKARK